MDTSTDTDRLTPLGRFALLRQVLMAIRAPLILTAVAAYLLLITGQGRAITAQLMAIEWHFFWFGCAVFSLAMITWSSARWMLDMRIAGANKQQYRLVRWPPRILGLCIFALGVRAVHRHDYGAEFPFWETVGLLTMMATSTFYWLYRRHFEAILASSSSLKWLRWLFHAHSNEPESRYQKSTPPARWVRPIPLVTLLSAIIIFVVTPFAWFAPIKISTTLGPAAMAVLGFTGLNIGAAVLVWIESALHRRQTHGESATERDAVAYKAALPIISLFALWAVISSSCSTNQAIRSLPSQKHQVDAAQTSISDFTQRWLNSKDIQAHTTPPPLIVVATAGGGVRAQYWTVKVLGELHDQIPEFRSHLFAISGVSGGSVGAAQFVTALRQQTPDSTLKKVTAPLLQNAGSDAVGPFVTTLLFTDLAQQLQPWGAFGPFKRNRAAVLEQTWEANWDASMPSHQGAFGRSFLSLWDNSDHNQWLPALLINSTHIETGRRVIISHLNPRKDKPSMQQPFADAAQFYDLFPCRIPISTAAHNSARFPYASPPGAMEGCLVTGENPKYGHLVDAGYFEVNAAETLTDLLDALERMSPDASTPSFRPIVLLLTNDEADLNASISQADINVHSNKTLGLSPDLLSPPLAVINTLGGHTRAATRRLQQWIDRFNQRHPEPDHQAKLIPFRVMPHNDEKLPLGWSLSAANRLLIDTQFACNYSDTITELQTLLNPASVPPPVKTPVCPAQQAQLK